MIDLINKVKDDLEVFNDKLGRTRAVIDVLEKRIAEDRRVDYSRVSQIRDGLHNSIQYLRQRMERAEAQMARWKLICYCCIFVTVVQNLILIWVVIK